MKTIPITYELARAVARDETERHMRREGRTVWATSDYDLAASIFNRLLPHVAAEQEQHPNGKPVPLTRSAD